LNRLVTGVDKGEVCNWDSDAHMGIVADSKADYRKGTEIGSRDSGPRPPESATSNNRLHALPQNRLHLRNLRLRHRQRAPFHHPASAAWKTECESGC
jgi:hypothetical protein